jgi:hypothetical protein
MNNFYYPAHYDALREQNLAFNRLYAYPSKPTITPNHKIILDSGAFHMHKARKPITTEYVRRLIEHYKPYMNMPNVYCIAADTPKNFSKSIDVTLRMLEYIPNICPVLHNTKKGCVDIFNIKKQVNKYAERCSNRFIAMSNNRLDISRDFSDIRYCVQFAKKHFKHVHIFGAGYTPAQVKLWQDTGADSVDSIGYYTNAQYGVVLSENYSKDDDFKSMSMKNLLYLNSLCA